MQKRKALAVLFLTIFLDLFGFGMIIPVLPILTTDLGATSFQLGIIASLYSLMNFLFSPFWGTMSDRYGRRPIMLTSILITVVAYLFLSQSTVIWVLVISRIFSGLGSANIGAAQAYIGDVTSAEDRAKSMGLVGAAFGLGFILGPPIGAWIMDAYDIHMLGYTAAGFSAINFGLAFFILKESIPQKNPQALFRFKIISSIASELKKPFIRELFLANFLFMTAFSMMQITAVLLWTEHMEIDKGHVGWIFMFIGACSVLVQTLAIGFFKKKFGEMNMPSIGISLLSVGLLIMPFVSVNWFMPVEYIALALISVSNGFFNPSVLSLITQVSDPKLIGKTTGLNQSLVSLGRVFGPLIGGALYDLDFHLPYIAGPVLLMIGLGLTLKFRQKFALRFAGSE
ncbi:MAG: MFS transporter [Bacteroidetes bacterium]|nr:MFS transporter [Bacteroidota bacterium]